MTTVKRYKNKSRKDTRLLGSVKTETFIIIDLKKIQSISVDLTEIQSYKSGKYTQH